MNKSIKYILVALLIIIVIATIILISVSQIYIINYGSVEGTEKLNYQVPLQINNIDFDVDNEGRIYFLNESYLMIPVYKLYTNEYLYSISIPNDYHNQGTLEMQIINNNLCIYSYRLNRITEIGLDGVIMGSSNLSISEALDLGLDLPSYNTVAKDEHKYTFVNNTIVVSENDDKQEKCFTIPPWNYAYTISYFVLIFAIIGIAFILCIWAISRMKKANMNIDSIAK